MRAGLTQTRFPFLERLTDDGRRELGALAPIRAAGGKHLLRRGDSANGAYLVVAGSLRVYYVTAAGREATLYRVEPGGTCVLALASTLSDEPYPAWVDAGPRGVELVRVASRAFHRLLESESAFRQFVFGALAGRVFELMSTLEELGSTQLEQRVARYLLRRRGPDDCVRISQVGIASELGTAREVVFRALRSLAARGLVATKRLEIRIVDPQGLSGVAGEA